MMTSASFGEYVQHLNAKINGVNCMCCSALYRK